jgi:hypothetical protein
VASDSSSFAPSELGSWWDKRRLEVRIAALVVQAEEERRDEPAAVVADVMSPAIVEEAAEVPEEGRVEDSPEVAAQRIASPTVPHLATIMSTRSSGSR